MKKLFLALSLLACTIDGMAQSPEVLTPFPREVRAIEGEIALGYKFGAATLGFDRQIGFSLTTELRYNLPRFPLDFGLQFSFGVLVRHDGGLDFTYPGWQDNSWDGDLASWNLLAVSDYNFQLADRISFFAGIGLGYARFDQSPPAFEGTYHYFANGGNSGGICVMPRIGFEFFRHLRLTLDYRLQERANRHFNINIGGVFGGGKKKTR